MGATHRKLRALGNSILGDVSIPMDSISSASPTLVFLHSLVAYSKSSNRNVGNKEIKVPRMVGCVLKSTKKIPVPVIDPRVSASTGVSAEMIGYRYVEANELFSLSMYELMFLLLQHNYAGICTLESSKGDMFSPITGSNLGYLVYENVDSFLSGKTMLPRPRLYFRTGSPRSSQVAVDEKVDGKWKVKQEYKNMFTTKVHKGVFATPHFSVDWSSKIQDALASKAHLIQSTVLPPAVNNIALGVIMQDAIFNTSGLFTNFRAEGSYAGV